MDTTYRKAPILIEQENNVVHLSADTPPLMQISGAPEAFYTYFWEFGDGQYSRDKNPEHVYEDAGEYEVRLQVTNNYDNGKPPPSRPQKININKTTGGSPSASIAGDLHSFDLLKSREPVPQEEMVVVMHYENELTYTTSGKLYLYYNERKYKANNFDLIDVRAHYGEQRIDADGPLLSGLFNHTVPGRQWASLSDMPQHHFCVDSLRKEYIFVTIDKAEEEFRNRLVLEFKDLAPNEKRNVFLSLKTTPEMIQDTSAIVKIRGVFVPDEGSGSHRVKDLEMEIVTSHDPNKMAVNDTRINYRFRKNKKLKYKVRFQNNGEGPASTIRLDVDMPSIIDRSTLEVLDRYPDCPICPDNGMKVSYSCLDTVLMEDKISFIFKNIYLPGSNQKGVEAYDSTKGFVKYSVKLHKKAAKINSSSRTAIIFDKNDPIYTNYAKTYFKPGLSLGAMAGYVSIDELQDSRSYFFGITASPYMSYRGYFQAELMATWGSYKENRVFEIRQPYGAGIDLTDLAVVNEYRDYNYLDITLVPVSYRYALNRFVGVGGGVQVSAQLHQRVSGQQDYQYFIEGPKGLREPNLDKNESVTIKNTEGVGDFNPGVFLGINLGKSRIGPAAGLRYVYQINDPNRQWLFYLIWKF